MPRQEYSSLRQGLVGCWVPSLGASGLSLIDRSGRNNHGTLTNMGGQGNWRASGSGVAINFDGTNDYVSLGSGSTYRFTSGQTFTAAAWIYPAVSKNQSILSFTTNGWDWYVASGNYVEFAKAGVANTGSSAATNGVTLNKWTHVAVKNIVGSTVEFFINGSSVRTAAFAQTYNYSLEMWIGATQDVTVGGLPDLLAWNGQLDDIRIYNRALTLAEIRLLASRRGIGLSPLPDRAAGLPRRFSVNVGGTWREADSYVNVGGSWKLAQPSVNVGGVWK